MSRIVHVVGTGTIGEPLIGLFSAFQQAWDIDEVSFHKRTPLQDERAKVESMVRRGAKLVVDADKVADFEALACQVTTELADNGREDRGGTRHGRIAQCDRAPHMVTLARTCPRRKREVSLSRRPRRASALTPTTPSHP